MKKRNILIIALTITCICAALLWWNQRETLAIIASQHEMVRGEISNKTLVFGKAGPRDVYDLSFDVAGKLTQYPYSEGQEIESGAVIAQLDSATVRSQISRAGSSVQIERSRLLDLQAPASNEEQVIKQTEIEKQALVLVGAENDLAIAIDSVLEDYRDLLDKEIDTYYLYPTREDALLRLRGAEDMTSERRAELSGMRVELENAYNNIRMVEEVGYLYALTEALLDGSAQLSDALAFELASENTLGASILIDEFEDFSEDMENLFDTLTGVYTTWTTAEKQLSILEKQLDSLLVGADSSSVNLQLSVINSRQSDLNALYTDLSKYTLESPIDGVVFDAPLNNFQTVSPGQIVLSIIENEPLVITAQVAESDVQFIGFANVASVTFDALPELEFTARVDEIKNRENQNSTVPTYETTFVFDAGQDISAVRSGMTANITVSSGVQRDVLSVPMQYINQENGMNFAEVLKADGTTRRVAVELGFVTTSGIAEIRSGLNEGEVVVIME